MLESTVEVAGVMVASGDKPVKGFSSDAPFPQKYLDIHHSDPSSTSPYVWNPAALQADSDTSTNNKVRFTTQSDSAYNALQLYSKACFIP